MKTIIALPVLRVGWFYKCIVHSHTCTVKLPNISSTLQLFSYHTYKEPYNLQVFLGRL